MKRKAVTLIIIYIILQLLDGLLTWIGTPDLALEGNPLVAYFGLGWIALFVANALVTCLLVGLTYWSFVLYKPPFFDVNGFKQYISMLFFNRPDCFHKIFYSLRIKNWKSFWAVFGYAFCYSMIMARICLIFNWLLYLNDIDFILYSTLRKAMPWGRLDIVIGIITMLFCICFWFYKQYKNNEKLRNEQMPKS